MNPEIKEQWVTALRSGDYQQGKGFLKISSPEGGEKYCCLGVLCDLAEKSGIVHSIVDEGSEYDTTLYAQGYDCFPPREVWEWAGLGGDNPEVTIPGTEEDYERLRSLVDLNDSGKTFSEIANLIEASL